jgi:hypothetical protein
MVILIHFLTNDNNTSAHKYTEALMPLIYFVIYIKVFFILAIPHEKLNPTTTHLSTHHLHYQPIRQK